MIPQLGAGILFGLVIYSIVCACRRRWPDGWTSVECGACGAGMAQGIHLAVAAWLPIHLVHHTDAHGDHVDLAHLFQKVGEHTEPCEVCVHLGEIHFVHIFLMGLVTVIMAAGGLVKYCQEHAHNKPSAKTEAHPQH